MIMYRRDVLEHVVKDIKILLVLAYFRLNCNLIGRIGFTLENIITSIGYVPCRNKDGINNKIKNQLTWLQKNNYMSFDCDINRLKPKDFVVATIVNDKSNIFSVDLNKDKFVILTQERFDLISQTKTKSDKAKLLNTYLHIAKRINLSDSPGSNKICYPSIKTLMANTGTMSINYMYQMIDELVEMGAIYKHHCGQAKTDKSRLINTPNIYAVNKSDLSKSICEAALNEHYAEKGIKIVSFHSNAGQSV